MADPPRPGTRASPRRTRRLSRLLIRTACPGRDGSTHFCRTSRTRQWARSHRASSRMSLGGPGWPGTRGQVPPLTWVRAPASFGRVRASPTCRERPWWCTYQGLKALGVPSDSLASFAPEFRQGMAATRGGAGRCRRQQPRQLGGAARELGGPRGAVGAIARRRATGAPGRRARRAHEQLAGVEVIWRQDCYQLPTGRTSFGFKDGIGQPAVEGSGIPGSNPDERPIKAGEFILGYPDETGASPPMPTPEVLGRNGTYLVFRKLHTRVAAYRQYLRTKAEPRGRGAARREDRRPLAERRAARAVPRARRSRARRGSWPQQRLPLRRRPARVQVSGRRARPTRQPPRLA